MTRIAISGAAGRMGRRLVALGSQDQDLIIGAAIDSPNNPEFDTDAGLLAGVGNLGLALSPSLEKGDGDNTIQAVIDFSVPAGAEAVTKACAEQGVPLVMATTGLSDEQKQLIHDASKTIPVVWAPNMSMAVNVAMKLTDMAANALKGNSAGVDVEILERHHRYKEDSPSGTALKFGEIVADAMGKTEHVHGREGLVGKRKDSEIGYHAIRTGDDTGQHTIVFGMLGETIEVTVRSSNRDCYALGALAAAKFVADKPPGIYSMYDVLGL